MIYLRWVKDDICVSDSEVLKVIEAFLGRSSKEAHTLHTECARDSCLVVLSSIVESFRKHILFEIYFKLIYLINHTLVFLYLINRDF